MVKLNNFPFEPDRVRPPSKVDVYGPNNEYELYKCHGWSFGLPDDDDVKRAEEAVYAWLSWWQFLKERGDGTEA